MPNGENQEYQPRNTMGNYNVNQYSGTNPNATQANFVNGTMDTTTSYGLESLTADSFMQDDGKTPKPLREIVDLLMKHKPWDDSMDITENRYRADMEKKVLDMMPKLQGISQKEKGFLGKEKGLAGQERALAMTKATDAYGLTTRGAQRGLGTALGQAQGQASSLGGQMRGAYGGGSMGMRGAIGGQQTLAKGVESAYGGYQDKMIGAQQQLGYAETAGGIGEQRAQLGYDKGMYGLEEGRKGEFEADITSFLGNFKQGGRVPTFSYILSKIPDAGGS